MRDKRAKAAVKRGATKAHTQHAAVLLRQIEYQLIGLLCGHDCPLNVGTADKLERVQRALREIRYQIEVERGFETPSIVASKS